MRIFRGTSFALSILFGVLSLLLVLSVLIFGAGFGMSGTDSIEPGGSATVEPGGSNSSIDDGTTDNFDKLNDITAVLGNPAVTAFVTALLSFMASIAPAFSRGTAIKSTSRVNIVLQLAFVAVLVVMLLNY